MEILQISAYKDYPLPTSLQQELEKLPRKEEIFVARKRGKACGIGVRWTNALHPTAKYLQIKGDFPIEYLTRQLAPQNKVIYACGEEEPLIPLLVAEGFCLVRETYAKTCPIEELLTQLKDVEITCSPKPLREVFIEDEESFFSTLKANYEATHLINPVAPLTWQEWQDLVLNDTPDLALSAKNGKDYILLHTSSQNHYELGWLFGTTLQPLFKWQLIKLLLQGVKTIAIEVDTTDQSALALFSFLDFNKIKAWHTYMKKV